MINVWVLNWWISIPDYTVVIREKQGQHHLARLEQALTGDESTPIALAAAPLLFITCCGFTAFVGFNTVIIRQLATNHREL